MLINEENNALAEKAFEVAKEYVRRNPSLGLAVDPVIVVGNRSDAKTFLENGNWLKLGTFSYLTSKKGGFSQFVAYCF